MCFNHPFLAPQWWMSTPLPLSVVWLAPPLWWMTASVNHVHSEQKSEKLSKLGGLGTVMTLHHGVYQDTLSALKFLLLW